MVSKAQHKQYCSSVQASVNQITQLDGYTMDLDVMLMLLRPRHPTIYIDLDEVPRGDSATIKK